MSRVNMPGDKSLGKAIMGIVFLLGVALFMILAHLYQNVTVGHTRTDAWVIYLLIAADTPYYEAFGAARSHQECVAFVDSVNRIPAATHQRVLGAICKKESV